MAPIRPELPIDAMLPCEAIDAIDPALATEAILPADATEAIDPTLAREEMLRNRAMTRG
jgi:hypothetical protein